MSKGEILGLIDSSDSCAVNALLRLYERQTADEQATDQTSHNNGVGFRGDHAGFLTSLSKQALANRLKKAQGDPTARPTDLSPRQIEAWRKIAPFYHRQLLEIVNSGAPAPGSTKTEEVEPEEEFEHYVSLPEEQHQALPAETPVEFTRSSRNPQAIRFQRAKEEGPAFRFVSGPQDTVLCHTPAGKTYTLTGDTCSCPDHTQRGETLICKHRIARTLYLQAEERAEQARKCSWSDAQLEKVFGL